MPHNVSQKLVTNFRNARFLNDMRHNSGDVSKETPRRNCILICHELTELDETIITTLQNKAPFLDMYNMNLSF